MVAYYILKQWDNVERKYYFISFIPAAFTMFSGLSPTGDVRRWKAKGIRSSQSERAFNACHYFNMQLFREKWRKLSEKNYTWKSRKIAWVSGNQWINKTNKYNEIIKPVVPRTYNESWVKEPWPENYLKYLLALLCALVCFFFSTTFLETALYWNQLYSLSFLSHVNGSSHNEEFNGCKGGWVRELEDIFLNYI